MMEQTIQRSAVAQLLPPSEQHPTDDGGGACVPASPVPVESRWSWRPQQPYVLRLDIAPDLADDHHVTWEISRDLVQAGLVAAEPVGEGDVTVFSTALDVHLWLSSPSGSALLRWDRAQVSAVLADSLHSRPNGADAPDTSEVDAWLAAITQED